MTTICETPQKVWMLCCSACGDTEIVHDYRANVKTSYGGGPWNRISVSYPTREALIEGDGIQPEPCKECGQLFGTSYCEPYKTRLKESGLCFGCTHWMDLLVERDNPSCFRIKGQHFKLGPGNAGGYGGRTFVIERKDGTVITTSDLWHQGVIPGHFLERLPDNASFVERPKPVGHGQGYLS